MKVLSKILKALLILIILILLYNVFNTILEGYRNSYFNGFVRAEYNLKNSNFTRDANIKYNDALSYRIDSAEFNDAMFYKSVDVKPNTAYKISCKIKTEGVIPKDEPSDSGAHIAIGDTFEKSRSITGTTEWQEVSLYFNSQNRTKVNIAFRLGGNQENCKGTAWFADFKLEQGMEVRDNKWNYACFIFENIDVNLENETIKISMNDNEISTLKGNIRRFEEFVEKNSNKNIDANCDIIEIREPITSVSYDKENGYYISGANIASLISKYIEEKDYQHIFAIAKFGNSNIEIPVNDWLGLGSMTYQGIGFSNIRVPGDKSNVVYEFNQFPEEVFVHEFLHDLERISGQAGMEIPALHDYANYGYEIDNKIGLSEWYADYMQNNILYNGEYIGVKPEVYKMKPVGREYVEYSMELEFVNEPKNIFEEIARISSTAASMITTQMEGWRN